MKIFLRTVLALVLAFFVAVAAGTLIPRPFFAERPQAARGQERHILLLSNPIHTDIAIPLNADTRAIFRFLDGFGVPVLDPQAQWLIVGWGGRAFYLETPTWADLKAGPLFRALTIDRSVLHVDVAGAIDESHPAVSVLTIDEAGFARLSAYVTRSFTQQTGSVSVIEGRSYGQTDRFFEAAGSFNALFGCNTWTAHALRETGLRTGLWNPLPQTLRLSLHMFN
ncbi:TIGR02117 family protein [Oryzifoliimicrobium ureilyticus]|uniref:TIGR02117 family protein n=1 Tax=Oryzifoliimicrobium ureilyticus TaxID=3113724 RepID=UPI003075FE48